MKRIGLLTLLFSIISSTAVYSQSVVTVLDSLTGVALHDVQIRANSKNLLATTDTNGQATIRVSQKEIQTLLFVREGYRSRVLKTPAAKKRTLRVQLAPLNISLPSFEVLDQQQPSNTGHLRAIEGTTIFNGMKSERIKPNLIGVDLAVNNSRQIFRSVPGLNIWENDGAGIQLSIGARGLSPNRTANFNVRQDMHDISADALGYPESYYTPDLRAVENIDLVRGAAALQFGTQFGGLLNFHMQRPGSKNGTQVGIDQGISSFGLGDRSVNAIASSNTYVEVDHRKNKLGVFAYGKFQQGNGWRPNSGYSLRNIYTSVEYEVGEHALLGVGLTHMHYLAQQPGGLTDLQFEEEQRVSFRERNWFNVDWNMATVHYAYEPSIAWTITSRMFGLLASRKAIGFLGQTQRQDPGGERDLILGDFANVGNETRILHRMEVGERFLSISGGFRVYRGTSTAQQGVGSAGSDADFQQIRPWRSPHLTISFRIGTLPPLHNLSFRSANAFRSALGLGMSSFEQKRMVSFGPSFRMEREM